MKFEGSIPKMISSFKLHPFNAVRELNRYLNAEKRRLVQAVENLWNSYTISGRALESERIDALKTLDGFMKRLGYFGEA
ncbi:MAG: hypothetical protein ACYC69_05135 [Thermodesulfovibrionales bacterium]